MTALHELSHARKLSLSQKRDDHVPFEPIGRDEEELARRLRWGAFVAAPTHERRNHTEEDTKENTEGFARSINRGLNRWYSQADGGVRCLLWSGFLRELLKPTS